MKILLISANKLTAPYPVYPLGLDYVANSIPPDDEYKIIDMNDYSDDEFPGNIIREYSPDIVGISLRNIDNTSPVDTLSFISHYQRLIERVKKNTDAVIVLGGSGFTIFPNELMDALNADYGIIGEGERFSLFLEAFRNGEKLSDIPGITDKKNPGAVPVIWDKEFSRKFETSYSHIRFYLKKGGMLNLQTKRGCTFKCIYCTYPHIEGNHLRLVPPEEVAETARKLQDAGAQYFFITDSAFNCDYSHSTQVAEAFIKAGITIPWGAFFSPTKTPEGYFELMKKAGLSHVEFGTESCSNEILKSYRKPFNIENVFHAHELANRAGLHVAHYMLLGGPGENSHTLTETLENAGKLAKTVIFFFCGIRIYPGTELYDIALKDGQITESQDLLMPVFYQSRSITSDEIIKTVAARARGKDNWIIGAGGEKVAKIINMMYRQGHSGPLWEFLIQ